MARIHKVQHKPPLSIERMANAEAAIETIALNNRQLLEERYHTTSSDVMALVQLAHAHWYQTVRGGE